MNDNLTNNTSNNDKDSSKNNTVSPTTTSNEKPTDTNVLDFLNDDVKTPGKRNSIFAFNNHKRLYLIIAILAVLLLVAFLIINISKKSEKISQQADLESYTLDITIDDNKTFYINKELTFSKVGKDVNIVSSIPLDEDSFIKRVEMDAANTEPLNYEKDGYKYFVFQNKEKRTAEHKSYLIHYEQEYPELTLEEIELPLIDAHSNTINNIQITVHLNNNDYKNYEYMFNRDVNCSYDKNKIMCSLDKLRQDENLTMSFKSNIQQDNGVRYSSNGDIKEYLLPVTVLNNNNLNQFRDGDVVNISSVGLNGNEELNGIIIRNIKILQFKDSSGEIISSSDLENIKYVVVGVTDSIESLLSNVPFLNKYLVLNLELVDNPNNLEPTIEEGYVTEFIYSASY